MTKFLVNVVHMLCVSVCFLAWVIKRKNEDYVVSHVSRGIFKVLTGLTANFFLGVVGKRYPGQLLCDIYCIT